MSVKTDLQIRHSLPAANWHIKDLAEDDCLALLHDQMFDIITGVIPGKYHFAKGSVYDTRTLRRVCRPLKVHVTFHLPDFPVNGPEIYISENRDPKNAMFEEHEKTARLLLDPKDATLEYCYEGKHLRAMRYRGKTHVFACRKLSVIKCRENDIAYTDVLKQTGVDVEALFDQSVECSEVILHFLMGFPTGCVKTRRQVVGPYLVLISIEDMNPSILTSQSHAPLVEPLFSSLMHRDDLDVPLGSMTGKFLLPVRVPVGDAPERFNGYDGEYLIVRDPCTNDVLGRICSTEAGAIRRLKPEGISGRSIAIECLRRSSVKDRETMMQQNNLPLVLNFRRIPLELFAEVPTLEPLTGTDIQEDDHTNWELLSSVCYLYLPDMRKCIAQNARSIQMEVRNLRAICLEVGLSISERDYDTEDFDFEAVLSTVRAIYEKDSLEEAKGEMKVRCPMLYTLMRPKGVDRIHDSAYLLPKYDAGTYESRGCPFIVRSS